MNPQPPAAWAGTGPPAPGEDSQRNGFPCAAPDRVDGF